MTMQPRSILHTIAILGLAAHTVAAQSARSTTQPPPAPTPRTAPSSPEPAGTSGTTAPATAAPVIRPWNEQEYRLGPGDKLRVEVYGESQLSQALQVRPDGKITLPLVGDVVAAGRTAMELRDVLTTALKSYVNSPAVTVIVQDAIANQIDVVGEIENPGQQVLMGPVNILQAISRAGGFKEFAKTGSVYVLRQTASGPQKIDANYKDALKGKVPPMVLQPGDTVVVP